MTKLWTLALALLVPTVLWSQGDAPKAKMSAPTKAVCVLHPLKDSKVHGVVVFTVKGKDIEIKGEIMGLTPGEHGFHVHEFGDCSSPDGMSTGGHFNPTGAMHGGPHAKNRHVGDLGNIMADGTGKAVIHMTDPQIKLQGANSIVGRALIVHAAKDDEKTDPAGNAGARIACGIIGIAKSEGMPAKK
jgi:Cu-Zn family superoxide dismutase